MEDKVYAYFDDLSQSNLSNIKAKGTNVSPITFDVPEIRKKLFLAGFDIQKTSDYSGFGIYLVSVQQDAPFWCGCTLTNKKHILSFIPKKVLGMAKKQELIIVIDNSSEGKKFNDKGYNAFLKTYKIMEMYGLPPFSVLVVNSNQCFFDEYDAWRLENKKKILLAHSYMINGFYYFDRQPLDELLINSAILDNESVDFNSLNRTVRHHRVDHLYEIIKNKWHLSNLVSGSYYDHFDNQKTLKSFLLNVSRKKYSQLLAENCPLYADGNWIIDNPDFSNQHIFNHQIYRDSLLSVVTETAFSEPGMFITEKSFKPIVAGHPFMILGQPFILEYLEKMGYKTDFEGIDQSYDKIVNPRDRFIKFHQSLKKWVDTPRKEKIKFLENSLDTIEHNRNTFLSNTYERDGYKNILNTVKQIRQGTYRV